MRKSQIFLNNVLNEVSSLRELYDEFKKLDFRSYKFKHQKLKLELGDLIDQFISFYYNALEDIKKYNI